MKFGQTEIPGSLFKLARERMLREATFTPGDIRAHLAREAPADLAAISGIGRNWGVIADRVTRACIDQLRTAGDIKQFKRGVWARSSFLAAGANDVSFTPEQLEENARLMRARASWEKATQGKWSWNCAGDIIVKIDGQDVVIGNFNGCETDAAAVCRLHNSALALFKRAGVTPDGVLAPATEAASR